MRLLLALGACAAVHSAAGATYRNPVVQANTPDPGVTLFEGTYYAVTTSLDDVPHFPIRTSSDLVTWTLSGAVFPAESTPVWARQDFWAPEMHWHPQSGRFLVLFTARNSAGSLSVGLALADHPLGPWRDLGREFITGPDGVIDPSFFYDSASNRSYVMWKVDGNAFGHPTQLWICELAPNGTALLGNPVQMIANDLPWEGILVEAPWLVRHPRSDYYFLFYSGNIFTDYAIGVARAAAPTGPYKKLGPPLLWGNSSCATAGGLAPWVGPGHCSVVMPRNAAPDGTWAMLYHAWPNKPPITFDQPRFMMMDAVRWITDAAGAVQWPGIIGCPSSDTSPVPGAAAAEHA